MPGQRDRRVCCCAGRLVIDVGVWVPQAEQWKRELRFPIKGSRIGAVRAAQFEIDPA